MTTPEDTRVTLSALMRAVDANLLGTVHGGNLMKAVDDAAGVVANRFAGYKTSAPTMWSRWSWL